MTSNATLLVEYADQLTEVLLGPSLLMTIRSALLDFDIQSDARDYQFTRMKGDVEAAVGSSVFEAEKGKEGFRVKLVKKGVKKANEKELVEQLKNAQQKLALSEDRRKLAEFQAQSNQRTIDAHVARLRKEEIERQEQLQTANRSAVKQEEAVSGSSQTLPQGSQRLKITVQHLDGSAFTYTLKSSTEMKKLYRAVAESTNLCEDDFYLSYEGTRIYQYATPAHYNIEDDDILELYLQQKGGKPLIYLLPPSPLPEASVQLTLIPQWEFSAIYPVVPASTSNERQSIKWTVSAAPGGMLVNKADNQPTPYLYWEALTNSKPSISELLFNPCTASLDPSNSMLLSIDDVVPHLQKTLEDLSLNVQARTDFITYWLPSLNKHKHIALRFLPQQEYATAAPLTVEPKPDVVTRVFMLSKGIKDVDMQEWSASASAQDWKTVVGVSAAAEDESKFRVLEWGGMEVLA